MKQIVRTLIILGIIILLIVVFILTISRSSINIPNINPIKENIGLTTSEVERSSGNEVTTFPIRESTTENITIRDFKNDPGVTEWGDKDTLLLGDGLINNDQAFQIFYYEFDKSFSIAILQEPIADVRKVAEAQLLERLQINTKDACNLLINVTVPSFVNENISGQNLGLSFCPGAVQL